MTLAYARQRLTDVAVIVSNTNVDDLPEDAGYRWSDAAATEINDELRAIEEKIDALRRKMYDLQA